MKKNKLRTSIIIIAAIIVFLLIAKKMRWIGASDDIEVVVESVSKRDITESVAANGKIQPEVEIKISADVSGEIVELHVKEGQRVEKGEHLLSINPDLIRAGLERAEATLNQFKANLANAKARQAQVEAGFINTEALFRRNEKIYKDKVISDAEFDASKAQFDAAKADLEAAKQNVIAADYSVKSAEASLREARDNLNRTKIYAPADGTISLMNVELGERVVGTAQMTGTELLRIANLTEMEVNVDVNENDIVRLHHGDTALVEVDAYGDREFKGIVTEIANSSKQLAGGMAASSDQVTNFNVKIRILRSSYQDLVNPDAPHLSPFRPGMSAAVEVLTRKEKSVLALPIMAVTTREIDDSTQNSGIIEKQEVVFKLQDGKAIMKKVKTGIQDNLYIQIIEGVAENDEVITAPYSAVTRLLKDGAAVKKTDAEKLNQKKE